jgi:hypothetical protein
MYVYARADVLQIDDKRVEASSMAASAGAFRCKASRPGRRARPARAATRSCFLQVGPEAVLRAEQRRHLDAARLEPIDERAERPSPMRDCTRPHAAPAQELAVDQDVRRRAADG